MLKKFFFIAVVLAQCVFSAPLKAAESCLINVINPTTYNKILDYLLISRDDVSLYKKIFRAIDVEDFKTADKLVGKLENNIILGHALAEKYLSRGYKASYDELKDWLAKYYDHPQANRIYNLAVRKGGAAGLTKPKKVSEAAFISGWDNKDIEKRTPAEKEYLRRQVAKFRKAMNRGKTKMARLVLEQKRFRMLAPDKYWDDMAATLAMKYFVDNYNQLAWQWGVKASRRRTSGTAAWVAGLSAWRMKHYKDAASYFSQLAKSKNSDEWLVSAGGYWGYRAYSRLNQPKQARQMLKLASGYKHTFYGILAGYQLGLPMNYNWDAVAYLNNFDSYDYVYELLASPSIRRAVILIHAKKENLAEDELRHGYNDMSEKQQEATIYIANQFQMHALAIYACNNSKDIGSEKSYDGVAYPIPSWVPASGWKVDKALVLALARQESSFRPEAQSPAGARGLMQLMPNTAYHITKDVSIKQDKNRLLRADYNLELGQKYVDYLMAKPIVDGNLFYMMTAYNAGPGNLAKWKKNTRYGNDPLLFIEAIPSSETRIYIERVTANYWIYNARFGMVNPTLQQVAEGKWPVISRD
mgnify:FL=1